MYARPCTESRSRWRELRTLSRPGHSQPQPDSIYHEYDNVCRIQITVGARTCSCNVIQALALYSHSINRITYIHTCVHTNIDTNIHTYIHTYIHTQLHIRVLLKCSTENSTYTLIVMYLICRFYKYQRK